MSTYYSPNGNPEVWNERPDGYFTEEEWLSAHPQPELSLEEVKAAKLAEINAGCDAILKQAVSGYPETEQQTFYKQDAESAAYLENPETETPFLTILAAARGIDLETMVTKVRAKTDAFSRLSAFICGQRQAMEDELDACASVEAVQTIRVSYQMPTQNP